VKGGGHKSYVKTALEAMATLLLHLPHSRGGVHLRHKIVAEGTRYRRLLEKENSRWNSDLEILKNLKIGTLI